MPEEFKPKVVLDNHKTKILALCCGDDCVDVPPNAIIGGGPGGPGSVSGRSVGWGDLPGATPLGGGAFTPFVMHAFQVAGTTRLMERCGEIQSKWKPATIEGSVLNGIIHFRVTEVDRIDLHDLRKMRELSRFTQQVVWISVFD